MLDALNEIKSITKRVPASTWTPEFREIANIAHRTLRDHANLEALKCANCGERIRDKPALVCERCVTSPGGDFQGRVTTE